jgi:hypothetical protein
VLKAEVEVNAGGVCMLLFGRLARANKLRKGRNGLRLIGKAQLSLHRATLAGPHAGTLDLISAVAVHIPHNRSVNDALLDNSLEDFRWLSRNDTRLNVLVVS